MSRRFKYVEPMGIFLVKGTHQGKEAIFVIPKAAFASVEEVEAYRPEESPFFTFICVLEIEGAPIAQSYKLTSILVHRDVKLAIPGVQGCVHLAKLKILLEKLGVIVNGESPTDPFESHHPVETESLDNGRNARLAAFKDNELMDSGV